MRVQFSRRPWLFLPGLTVTLFALAAIALPVRPAVPAGGPVGALQALAADIHYGFWRGAHADSTERALARQLAAEGDAYGAVLLYRELGVNKDVDVVALWDLNDRLILDGRYDTAEWYVRAADALLGSNALRNNLAWHYTQTSRRPAAALELARESVAAGRNLHNVDTLAWAYWANGMTSDATAAAHETFRLDAAGQSGLWDARERAVAKASSARLLRTLVDEAAAAR